ncbi:glycogen/starch/alpha-glucan phosphorylase [Roseomonas sp. CCTCC AB2023176]|uniref:glycogen/starch/alpha-glucan phosphorylase n=1 Tax=Roseomonas sp. CCTCC AB2023176 TaxID=3342640 RepID=UPI0035DBC8A0
MTNLPRTDRLLGRPPTEREVESFRQAILAKLAYNVGGRRERASNRDWFMATALAARDHVVDGWQASYDDVRQHGRKVVCYLSLEFLIGRVMSDVLGNLGLMETARAALSGIGVDLDAVMGEEADAALGNGGLGRLAACFMESMSSVGVPAFGYGIRYEHGLFRQVIAGGEQREVPEDWLTLGNPWEFERSGLSYEIGFGGTVRVGSGPAHSSEGGARPVWTPAEIVRAIAYDTPVPGWRGKRVNTLRLWSARAPAPLDLEDFNRGDHLGAQEERMRAEAISRVLYPGDDTPAGQELRLRQEYFFAAASLRDIVRRHMARYDDLRTLPDHAAVQLNDTHPAIGIAEMMRLLMDEHGLEWETAWSVTRATFSYTNHTLLPEALESWPVGLMERLLPRHMQIIYLLNAAHLEAARASGADDRTVSSVSLIDEHDGRRVRMGHLAFVGAHKTNGVSALHSRLLKDTVFRELDAVLPDRITNKTNGVTFRRWLHRANPGLTSLLVDSIGPAVLDDPERLQDLLPLARDPAFRDRFAAVRRAAKVRMADLVSARLGVTLDPDALFDVQIKRIHEYKRQLLNIVQTVALYNAMRAIPGSHWTPRVKLFAGKAAASYHTAKAIIRLANDVAAVVNNDPSVRGLLKVAFVPNYNVSLAEVMIPATDLSEQISTAGFEASGTGNMKMALNGALTIGTLDGANIEIGERVGEDNIFIFGLTAAEVAAHKRDGYDAHAAVEACPELKGALDAIASGVFSPDEPGRYRGLMEGLLNDDRYLITADFESYAHKQREASERWKDPARWWRSAVMNTAKVAWFSSDRTIREYAAEIWEVTPV